MCEHIKAKSLKFLSLDGLYKALIGFKEIIATLNLLSLFHWDYPIKPHDAMKNLK